MTKNGAWLTLLVIKMIVKIYFETPTSIDTLRDWLDRIARFCEVDDELRIKTYGDNIVAVVKRSDNNEPRRED